MRPRRLIALLVAPVVVVACNSPSEPAGRASPDGPVADLQSTCEDANGQLSFSGFRWQTIAQADPDPKSISVYNRANTCVGLDGALTVRLDRTAQDGLWQGGELMLAAGASGTAVLGAGRYEYVLDAIDPSVAADAVLGLFSYPVRDPADTSDDGEHDAIDIEVTATRWGVPGAQNTQPGVLQYTDYLPAGSNPTNLSFRKAGVTFQGDLSQRTRHTYEWIDDGTVHFRSDVIADDGTVLRPIADAVIGAPVSRPNLRVLLNSWMFAELLVPSRPTR